MRGLCLAAIPALALAHGLSRGSASVRDGVVVPPHGSAKYSLNITTSELSSPHDAANVSWSGISEAASGDWIAVCCDQPTGGYYWWQYTSGRSQGSQEMHLWATGLKSGCDNIYVAYYTSGNTVIGESPLIPVRPMIQQVWRLIFSHAWRRVLRRVCLVQVHLSLVQADDTSVVIEFVSSGSGADFSCSYGLSPSSLTSTVPATSFGFPTIGSLAQVSPTRDVRQFARESC